MDGDDCIAFVYIAIVILIVRVCHTHWPT